MIRYARRKAMVVGEYLVGRRCIQDVIMPSLTRRVSEGWSYRRRFRSLPCRVSILIASVVVQFGAATSSRSLAEDSAAAAAGQSALESLGSVPWYNSQTDGLQPMAAPPAPNFPPSPQWEWAAAQPSTTTAPLMSWDGVWEFLQILVWILLASVFLYLAYLWVSTLVRRRLAESAAAEADAVLRREADLIEHLPFQVQRPTQDLLAEARAAYQTGDYRAAIIYLFSYELIQLDHYQHIRLNKGKTNRQYLFELRRMPPLHSLLNRTVVIFEEVFFGHYPLERQRFEMCWNQLDEFQRLLKPVTPASEST